MIAGIANSPSVAEHALFMMWLAKRAVEMDTMVKENRWATLEHVPSTSWQDRAHRRLRPHRHPHRQALPGDGNERPGLRSLSRRRIKAAGCEPVTDLDAALPRADFVSIHCPKTPETVGMFNAARLKHEADRLLIDTARGGIVDEAALHEARSGKLAGAGLDVFERGRRTDHSLFKLSNVIIAPHVAGVTQEAVDRMSLQTPKKS